MLYFIATGGTIAMKTDPLLDAPVPALNGEDLVQAVPALDQVDVLETGNFANIPSGHMTPDHWRELHKAVCAALAREDMAGVIIAHGTDTLEETAWFLDVTVDSEKPVVLVGAQHHASDPDFDGPRNLLHAARICATPEARGKGVLICLNGNINAARDVTKTHTSNVETFKSGDMGLLGFVDADRVVFCRQPLRRQHLPLRDAPLPRVDIVCAYAGADATALDAAREAGARGVVVAGLGMGNVPPGMVPGLRRCHAAGMAVVISTRVPNGRVLPWYGYEGGGKLLQQDGAIFADNLSPQKSRILLMLALQHLQASRSEAPGAAGPLPETARQALQDYFNL